MPLHPLNWKAASPVLTPERGVRGTQYLFDDEAAAIIAQEVVDYDEELRQVLGQVTLASSEIPNDVQQLVRCLDLGVA
jgi:hypothetical protein